MELSREQQISFDKYVQGHNIFITGPGGTGKSELIRIIYKHANSQLKKNIHVTALTGCASILLNCKAKTIHSWAGIGLGNGTIKQLVTKIKKNKLLKKVWNETDILIVDEVSMLSLKLFNMLNDIGKAIRGNKKPFGGIQLIFSGDFYQLPPVGHIDDLDTQRFCFESDDWNSVFRRNCQIELKKIFRQTDDTYCSILNQIREGRIKKRSNELLLQYVGRKKDPNLATEPTKLFPTKNKVEQINISKMSALDGEEREYKMQYKTKLEIIKGDDEIIMDNDETENNETENNETENNENQVELDLLAANLMCEKELKIKVGSQVMCIINIKSKLTNDILICNGSQGIVTEFCEKSGYPKVKYNNGIHTVMKRHTWISDKNPDIGVSQVPLILSWALTIHKSQGATLDAAEIDVGSGIFECGQTYVALSRVKSLNGLYLTSFDASRIRINKKVKEFYETLRLYHDSKEQGQEVYVPLLIAEEIPIAIPDGTTNRFIRYEYVESRTELTEEKYDETPSDIKVIKIT
jgi:ATP-dependent DNA helicase PIF1